MSKEDYQAIREKVDSGEICTKSEKYNLNLDIAYNQGRGLLGIITIEPQGKQLILEPGDLDSKHAAEQAQLITSVLEIIAWSLDRKKIREAEWTTTFTQEKLNLLKRLSNYLMRHRSEE